jgi:hypothetical protein
MIKCRRMTGRVCSTNGEKMTAYRLLVAKPDGKKLVGRPKRRWVDNIRRDLVGGKWNAPVNVALNLCVP